MGVVHDLGLFVCLLFGVWAMSISMRTNERCCVLYG